MRIALGMLQVSACALGNPDADDRITVAEILAADADALHECSAARAPSTSLNAAPRRPASTGGPR